MLQHEEAILSIISVRQIFRKLRLAATAQNIDEKEVIPSPERPAVIFTVKKGMQKLVMSLERNANGEGWVGYT
jgi:hypothetical protein